MEHYNRYQQTRFNKIDENWRQNPNREKDEMYRDNRKYYREQYYDPNRPSYPVPYAKNFAKEQGTAKDRYDNYNDPAYYKIKRKEFGHGPGRNMNPGVTENYGESRFYGPPSPSYIGRDYEQNVGYRENYNRLDTRPDLRYDYESRQVRGRSMGTQSGKGPRSYKRTDERILEDINDRMCDNPYLNASDIDVDVKDGEVILTGMVDDRGAKRLAADIGESVSGVKNVENRLRVK